MDREGFREGREGVVWSEDERRPNPTKGTRPPPQRTERDSERGEGVLDESGWTGEGNRVVGREGCFEGGDGVGGW